MLPDSLQEKIGNISMDIRHQHETYKKSNRATTIALATTAAARLTRTATITPTRKYYEAICSENSPDLSLVMALTTTPTPMEAPTTTTVREARPTLPPLEDLELVDPARNKLLLPERR
jgi:hypothetical protein